MHRECQVDLVRVTDFYVPLHDCKGVVVAFLIKALLPSQGIAPPPVSGCYHASSNSPGWVNIESATEHTEPHKGTVVAATDNEGTIKARCSVVGNIPCNPIA